MKRRSEGKLPRAKRPMHVSFEEPATSVVTEEKKDLDTEDLMNLKPEEIATLKNYKKEISDDMDKLSHLESAKSKIFERVHSQEDDPDTGNIEKFTSESEEARRCLRDPLSKHRESKQKQKQSAIEDHWYNEYMEQQKQKSSEESFLSTEAKLARAARLDKQKKNMSDPMEDEGEDLDALKPEEIVRRMISLLHEKETIAGALRRLSGMPSGTKRRNSNKKKQTTQVSEENKVQIEKLTELATICTARRYFPDIYSVTREILLEKLGQHVNKGSQKVTKSSQWEYKLSANDSNVFGPFDTATMKAWQSQGYFANDVPIRKVGQPEFLPASQVDFTD